MTEASKLKSLNDYYSPMAWEWYQLTEQDVSQMVFAQQQGFMGGRATSSSTVVDEATRCRLLRQRIYGLVRETVRHPTKVELMALMKHAQKYGLVACAEYLWNEFMQSYHTLFDRYDLSEDGSVRFDPSDSINAHSDIAANFNNIVVAGRRFIERTESLLKKIDGESSQQYQSWRKMTSTMFDKSLDYAFCYHCRNAIEHGMVLVSVVNCDFELHAMGVAINLDAGILDKGILGNCGIENSGVRRRLREFREERLSQGEKPWLSVASVLTTWKRQICMLFINLLESTAANLRESPAGPELAELLDAYNALVWHCADEGWNDRHEFKYAVDRIYTLPPADYIDELQLFARGAVDQADIRDDDVRDKMLEVISQW